MTVETILPPQESTSLPVEHLGAVGLSTEVSATALRSIEVNGKIYQTEIPKDVDVIDYETEGYPPGIKVGELDKLPEGQYTLFKYETKYTDAYGKEHARDIELDLEVFGTPKGKAVSAGNIEGTHHWFLASSTERLMEELGYIIERDSEGNYTERIKAVPTPETVKAAASKLGVDVEFFPDDIIIKGPDYLKAYSEGKYPASFGDYQHDIEDDHLTAVVLGGEPLKRALKKIAERSLLGDERAIRNCAIGIDSFTVAVRKAAGRSMLGDTSREALRRVGESLDLSVEEVDEILDTAQQNARKFGIENR